MLTTRAWAVLGGAAALWAGSRVVGSPDLHMLAVGLLALVALALLFVRLIRPELRLSRRLSTRRAFPGSRVRVEVEVHNRGRSRAPFLLLEDRLPPSLGGSARAVLAGVPSGGRQSVTYHVTARARGRYELGPGAVAVADPFDLIRQRTRFGERHELIVYPEVEDLMGDHAAAPAGTSGESSSRQLFRTGEEFYTMRPYEIGDDLRRIHWPSTARTGDLMIRQDETARRATAVVLLDTRARALGVGSEAFERAVSAAASVGILYLRLGYSLRFSTPDLPPTPVPREHFLETLALVGPSRAKLLTPTLRRVRPLSSANPSLVVVTHVPDPAEVALLTRSVGAFATRTAILVTGRHPETRGGSELKGRLGAARTSMRRAGWEVLVLDPGRRLREVWPWRARLRTAASS